MSRRKFKKYKIPLKDRATLMEKALDRARIARVPAEKLVGLNDAQEVLDAIHLWVGSPEFIDLVESERRTEDHDKLLKFIQWYLKWEKAEPDDTMKIRRVQSLVRSGARLEKLKWLSNMMERMIKSGQYDPSSNLKRPNAPWS